MGFSWGAGKSFDAEPYDMPGFDIWGKEISAPDGSLITYGAGMIKIKFKSIPVKVAKVPGKYPFKEFAIDWQQAQTAGGKMWFNLWSPKTQAFESCYAVPKWPDPSGKFNGPDLKDFVLEIYAPFLSESYTEGPINVPITEPPNYSSDQIQGGFGVGHFGYGEFGIGEVI